MTAKATSDITFFMIGCQRCGTTWTDAALRDHPQVYLPAKKQSYFFDKNYENGIDWFMDRFDDVEEHHQAVGEIATGYCLLHSIPLMAKHFPNIKLLMVMRNPTDRAYSNFQTRQIESNWASFEDAIESDLDLLERGQYIDQIHTLLKYYDREQILFLLYEDLHTNDRAYLASVLEFIGVESNVESKMLGQRKKCIILSSFENEITPIGVQDYSFIDKSLLGRRLGEKK
jgi:hypothetical protein